jgi:hypothetical protein
MLCCIKGCDRPRKARGYCSAHYERYLSSGDMSKPIREVFRGDNDIERLKSKVEVDPDTGCWVWRASINTNGYGQIRFRGRPAQAHRVSWILHHGEIPGDSNVYGTLHVLHRCDRPLCVNPAHLFIGNQSDNAMDAVEKERWHHIGPRIGERHGRARLTEEDVRAIRTSLLPARELARRYGISPGAVQHILKRRSWKHID